MLSRTNPHVRIKLLLHQRHCDFGVTAAIPVLVNIVALRLVRNAKRVESLVISLVQVKKEQESKQVALNSQIWLMMMQMRRSL